MRWKTAPCLLVGTALLVFFMAGCRASSQEGTEPAAAGPTTPPEAAPTEPDPTPTYPPPDLAARPQIWFSPLDPTPPDANRPFTGSQFFDLFAYPDQWQEAASRTHVFKLYGGWVAWKASLEDLKQVVDFAEQHGLALAFEAGPLIPTDVCTGEIEGFAGPSEAARIVEKIKSVGGTIVYVDLEHPYDAATFYDAPQACRMEPEEIAHNISAFIAAVREVFPEARFGAVETAQHDLQHIASWVEAYRSVQGEDLAYFHLDLNYGDPAWAEEAFLIESYLKEQGIEFGIFYRGEWGDATSADWIARAEETIIEYEVRQGGRPDQVIFQSWHPQPEELLPETDPGAFTYLINRYYRERTTIDLEAAAGGSGLLLQGNLQGSSTGPLPVKPSSSPWPRRLARVSSTNTGWRESFPRRQLKPMLATGSTSSATAADQPTSPWWMFTTRRVKQRVIPSPTMIFPGATPAGVPGEPGNGDWCEIPRPGP